MAKSTQTKTAPAPGSNPAPEATTDADLSIHFPVGPATPDDTRYMPRDVHLESRLTHSQSVALRRIADGLEHSRARLTNGKYVDSSAAAVRWLLEQACAAIEAADKDTHGS